MHNTHGYLHMTHVEKLFHFGFDFMNFEEYRKVRIPTAVDRKNAEILLQTVTIPTDFPAIFNLGLV